MSSFIKDSWNEFWRSYMSKFGVVLLLFLTSISLYTVLTYPLDFGTKFWNNPIYWADNPKSVPPTWVNLFTSNKLLPHSIFVLDAPTAQLSLIHI